MRIPFLSRREPEDIDPLERVENAIDELNAALAVLKKDEEHKHLRPWVRPGDWRTKTKPKVMLGYWSQADEAFITVYGED